MKALTVLCLGLIASSAYAADPNCWGAIDGQGYSWTVTYPLAAMPNDPLLLIAKKDQFSFVVDMADLKTKDSLRLFIHDTKGNYTAMSDGGSKMIGSTKVFKLQQVIGYGTSNPATLTLNCNL